MRILCGVDSNHKAESSWVSPTHDALIAADIRIVGHVPDGGLRHLIRRLEDDRRVTTVPLSTEEEGVALAAGAWLGGSRAAVLMQSSGVGNCTNMLSLLRTCGIPTVFVVTMRGQHGESNPWQVPMSEAVAPTFDLMGVGVTSVGEAEDVAPAVAAAAELAFDDGGPAAVLIEQQVVGVKLFAGDVE